jgi:hypothetical protein
MLSVTSHKQTHYGKCRYAECRYGECHYAECRGALIHAIARSPPLDSTTLGKL